MIEETYSPAFLVTRTAPADGGIAARRLGLVRVQVTHLMKSVIKTPMSNGKVDYESVPTGASIWVTVKDESSPMHGRPILISKRPDGHFALEGGSGVSHWHDDPEREKKIAARRHLVLQTPHPDKAKAESAKKPADEAKVQQKNEERATAKVARDDAARQTREAVGVTTDPKLGRKEREQIAEHATSKLQDHGLSPKEAQSAAKHLPGAVQEARNRVVAHHVAGRVDSAHNATGGRLARTDDHQPAQDQRSAGFRDRGDDLPDHGATSVAISHKPVAEAVKRAKATKGGDLSAPEMEQTVKQAVHSQVDNKLSRDTSISGATNAVKPNFIVNQDEKEADDDTLPVADIGAWKPHTPEEATNAVKTFQREAEARGFKAGDVQDEQVANAGQQTIPGKALDRSLVDAEGLSDSAYDRLLDHYRQSASTPSGSAFYGALGEHWHSPDDYANSISGHVSTGAANAWTRMASLGMSSGGIDVPGLLDRLGVEGAAHILAAQTIAVDGTPQRIDDLVKHLTGDNAHQIAKIEQQALAEHAALQPDARALERGLDDGHGDDHDARIAAGGAKGMRARAERQRLYAENIAQQRAVLGGALGQMQFRATFLNALERFGKAAKAGTGSVGVPVKLTFGDDEQAADEALHAMRLGQGAAQKLHDTRHGWTLQVDSTRLKGYAEKLAAQGKQADVSRETQADESPADDYHVPDEAPDTTWTPKQRNDIEFLHQGGGGVLAGSRDGGKRTAALGYLARQIADNPRHKALVTTDAGGAALWGKLAGQRHPAMRTTIVPPDASPRQIEAALDNFPMQHGGVLVLGHHQLSRRVQDRLGRLADGGHIQSHVLDNPPIEGWGRDKHLTEQGHEIAGLSQDDGIRRVALTDHHPVEQPGLATQLAAWSKPHEVGFDHLRKARDAATALAEPNESNDGAIRRQVVDPLAAHVAADPFSRPAPPPEDPKKARQRIAREEKKAIAAPAAAGSEDEARAEFKGELERAVSMGNHDEARAILSLAEHYNYSPQEAQALHDKLSGAAQEAIDTEKDQHEIEQIRDSPYFASFEHFNPDSTLKRRNPKTGTRIVVRDPKTGKIGQGYNEVWDIPGSGYDEVAAAALSSHEGGHNQNYGMDTGDYFRTAQSQHKRYNELLRRNPDLAPPPPRKVKGIFASRPSQTLPGTPDEGGEAKFTPITMQPGDEASGQVVPTNKPRPTKANTPTGMLAGTPKLEFGGAQKTGVADRPVAAAPSDPNFKLQMQYGGLTDTETDRVKQEDAGQQSLGMDVPTQRVRKKVRKSLGGFFLRRSA